MKCNNCGKTVKSLQKENSECPDCGESLDDYHPDSLIQK
jgi:rRNA maturation endonuclease Nob1